MPRFFYTGILINISILALLCMLVFNYPPSNSTKALFIVLIHFAITFSATNILFFRSEKKQEMDQTEVIADKRTYYRNTLKKAFKSSLIVTVILIIRFYII